MLEKQINWQSLSLAEIVIETFKTVEALNELVKGRSDQRKHGNQKNVVSKVGDQKDLDRKVLIEKEVNSVRKMYLAEKEGKLTKSQIAGRETDKKTRDK